MHLRPSRFGLRTRLLTLVLAPALLLAAFGGSTAAREYRAASALEEVRERVVVLTDLTTLRRLLLGARAPIELELRAASLGIDSQTALRLLGVDRLAADDLDDVATQLARLPSDARPFSTQQLDQLQAAIDRDDGGEVIDQFDQLDQLAREQWERRIGEVRRRVVDTGSTRLGSRLDDLEASTRAGSAAGLMVTQLAAHWFGILDQSDRAEAARTNVAVGAQQFSQAMRQLEASADPSVAASAEAITASQPGTPFAEAVDDAVAGRPPAPFGDGVDVDAVATTFASSFELYGPLLDVMDERAGQLETTAGSLVDQARRTAAITMLTLIGAMVLLLVVSLAVASTLERPLGRLIEGTRRVGEGDLDVEPLPVAGPVEFAEATAAFNDVVANLRLLEGKVDALASSDLDDARLRRPLPGALGESMERSIQVLSDSIADRDALQARLAYQATHDSLTALPNRPGALDALERAIARSKRTGSALAVAFLDLDGFKAVNDTFGHQAGDDVLCEVARRLDDEARTGDFCARLGGDEFIIVAENVGSIEGAKALARRVAHRIAEPFVIGPAGRNRTSIGVSIGLALRTRDTDTPLSMLARADEAAYRAKRASTSVEIAPD